MRLRWVCYEPGTGPAPPPAAPVRLVGVTATRAAPRPACRRPTRIADPHRRTEPTEPTERTEASRIIARQLRTALEVLDGRRPATHLENEATPSVLRYWRVAAAQRRVRSAARFTRMRLCLPGPGIAEVAVTCEIDGRARALAARYERRGHRWRCTAVRLG